jgi:phosphoribosylformylglycinamidine (FGAM) synthase-like amidotransferase family enzyme
LKKPGFNLKAKSLLKELKNSLSIYNGFQELIKLGLVPYGEIRDTLHFEYKPLHSFSSLPFIL